MPEVRLVGPGRAGSGRDAASSGTCAAYTESLLGRGVLDTGILAFVGFKMCLFCPKCFLESFFRERKCGRENCFHGFGFFKLFTINIQNGNK